MALSERVTSRLFNWKFETAEAYMREEQGAVPGTYGEDEWATIITLSELFGNLGHQSGAVSTIIRASVAWLLQQPLDVPDDWVPDSDGGGGAWPDGALRALRDRLDGTPVWETDAVLAEFLREHGLRLGVQDDRWAAE